LLFHVIIFFSLFIMELELIYIILLVLSIGLWVQMHQLNYKDHILFQNKKWKHYFLK